LISTSIVFHLLLSTQCQPDTTIRHFDNADEYRNIL